MGILNRLFGASEPQITQLPPCPHVALLPLWDSVEDIGHDERASAFVCEACGETFAPEAAMELRDAEAERLSQTF